MVTIDDTTLLAIIVIVITVVGAIFRYAMKTESRLTKLEMRMSSFETFDKGVMVGGRGRIYALVEGRMEGKEVTFISGKEEKTKEEQD